MLDKRLLDEMGERIADAVRSSPAQDIEKNLRALVIALFDRYDIVSREDFDVQRKLLDRAQEKLITLEARVLELEAKRNSPAAE